MSDPGATERAARYIHPARRAQDAGLSLDQGRCGQETADGTDPACTVSLRALPQTLLTEGTLHAIHLESYVDGSLGVAGLFKSQKGASSKAKALCGKAANSRICAATLVTWR
jgi:hypothetical protein